MSYIAPLPRPTFGKDPIVFPTKNIKALTPGTGLSFGFRFHEEQCQPKLMSIHFFGIHSTFRVIHDIVAMLFENPARSGGWQATDCL